MIALVFFDHFSINKAKEETHSRRIIIDVHPDWGVKGPHVKAGPKGDIEIGISVAPDGGFVFGGVFEKDRKNPELNKAIKEVKNHLKQPKSLDKLAEYSERAVGLISNPSNSKVRGKLQDIKDVAERARQMADEARKAKDADKNKDTDETGKDGGEDGGEGGNTNGKR